MSGVQIPGGSTRSFPICADHRNADWNQPSLDDDACVLCRLFYLEAQESLLEEWQERAKKAEEAIAEIKRPLDAEMARLNARVIKLNAAVIAVCSATRGSRAFESALAELRKVL